MKTWAVILKIEDHANEVAIIRGIEAIRNVGLISVNASAPSEFIGLSDPDAPVKIPWG